jgi:hypothetical protein
MADSEAYNNGMSFATPICFNPMLLAAALPL